MQGDRVRLGKAMYRSVKEQRLTWQAIQERGGPSVSALRRVARKPESTLTEKMKAAIEDGMRWLRGDVDRILAGGDYTYRNDVELPGQRPRLDPKTSSAEDILAFLKDVATHQPEVHRAALQAIDVTYFATQPNRPTVVVEGQAKPEVPNPTK